MKPLPDHGPTHEAGASCCTTFYEQDWVRVLANDIFHPGGAALTRRTAAAMNLAPGHRLLDLGATAGVHPDQRRMQRLGVLVGQHEGLQICVGHPACQELEDLAGLGRHDDPRQVQGGGPHGRGAGEGPGGGDHHRDVRRQDHREGGDPDRQHDDAGDHAPARQALRAADLFSYSDELRSVIEWIGTSCVGTSGQIRWYIFCETSPCSLLTPFTREASLIASLAMLKGSSSPAPWEGTGSRRSSRSMRRCSRGGANGFS